MSHTILPPVVLAMDAEWPTAGGGRPAGSAEVGAWSVEREIVSSSLPGSLRTRAGLSVGSGSATIGQRSPALAPWAQGLSQRVGAGVKASLYADLPAGREPFGSWVTGEVAGSLGSAEVSIPLIEAQGPGKRGAHTTASGMDVEPAALIADLARQCGFHSVPPPVTGALWAFPVSYGIDAFDKGAVAAAIEDTMHGWGTATGTLGAKGFGVATNAGTWTNVVLTLTVNASDLGTVTTWFSDASGTLAHFSITPSIRRLTVTPTGGSAASVTWTGGGTSGPQRIQIGIRLTGAPGAWTKAEARARAGQASPWTAWTGGAPSAPTAELNRNAWFSLSVQSMEVSGVQVSLDADDPALYASPTASVEPIGYGARRSRWMPGDMAPWDLIQELCSAHVAATWVTRHGKLVTRNRDYLSGSASTVHVIDVASRVEDIAWSIDPADSADRLEVTFTPGGEVAAAGGASTIYAAAEKLSIPGKGYIDVVIPLEGPATYQPEWDHASWVPAGSDIDSWPRGIFSCFTAPEGGTLIDPGLTSFIELPSSSGSIKVRITNRSSNRAWLVDANGAPCLIVKGKRVRSFGAAQSIARGLAAAQALNPATVDLGHWVQDANLAEQVADFLWGRLNGQMWKAGSMRVVPDWAIDIGQVVELSHPESALSARALVTKASMSGQPGEITQSVDLVLLPPTWADFGAAWSSKSWSEFDALYAAIGQGWATSFDFHPTRTA